MSLLFKIFFSFGLLKQTPYRRKLIVVNCFDTNIGLLKNSLLLSNLTWRYRNKGENTFRQTSPSSSVVNLRDQQPESRFRCEAWKKKNLQSCVYSLFANHNSPSHRAVPQISSADFQIRKSRIRYIFNTHISLLPLSFQYGSFMTFLNEYLMSTIL